MSLAAKNLSDSQEGRVLKIMIVDDLSINRTLVRVLLNKRNIKVVEAKNGKEALNCFTQEQPDLVLMDISMPVMNGIEAVAKIRMFNGNGKTTPIIAFTSGEHKESKTELFEQGFSEYLLKPFKKRELYNKISLFLPMHDGIQNGVSTVKTPNI